MPALLYVFERDLSGAWIEQDKLLAPDGVEGHNFGGSVAIDGDRAVVGATGDAEQGIITGAAYVFERNGSGDWTLVDKLLASDGVTDHVEVPGRLRFDQRQPNRRRRSLRHRQQPRLRCRLHLQAQCDRSLGRGR